MILSVLVVYYYISGNEIFFWTSDFSEYNNKRQSVTDVLRWSYMCYPDIPEYPVDVGCGGEFFGDKKSNLRVPSVI